jgi:preprotein translocase subunit SecF
MELFNPKHLTFDFVKRFRLWMTISAILCVLSVIGIFYPGINYGIDFRGGIEASVSFKDPNVRQADLRELLDKRLRNLSVINYGDTGRADFMITAQSTDKASVSSTLKQALQEKYGPEGEAWTTSKVDMVGPKVGADLRRSALLALIYTCLLVTIYMYWRFDIRYSPGALACIFHDLLLTTGFLVATRGEFDTTVLAALLTLAGYSINDTVVVYDRIRETEGKNKNRDRKLVVNEAINSTLSRTTLTAGTTLLSCAVLYFVGGPTLREFSVALFVGIVVGTYSSAFIAAPMYLWADRYFGAKSGSSAPATVKS